MSFDLKHYSYMLKSIKVSIPFEQGDVFRQELDDEVNQYFKVSIPFEQGDVFRRLLLCFRH